MKINYGGFGLIVLATLCATTLAQVTNSAPIASPQDASQSNNQAMTQLQRAMHFADLYNWHASRAYFIQAEQLFAVVGDKRNQFYAHVGALRAGADPAPLTELSYSLAEELARNPILQSDKELRMFCLTVKGDFDGEIDVPAMRRDWTEVANLATQLANKKWEYRAVGQLGFADFYEGDLASAQRSVGTALIAAFSTGDIGAQIFYLSATANGMLSQEMNDQAISYAERAIAIAEANPDSGFPVLAHHAKLLAMVQSGKVEGAQIELEKLLVRANKVNDRYQLADLYSTASLISKTRHDIPSAIANLNEALRFAQAGYGSPTTRIQSDLSELYRERGDLPKAEQLARNAVDSAQAVGYVPLVPTALHSLAEVLISEKKYAEADRTYDRAAIIQDGMIGNADTTLGKTALIKSASDLYAKHFALVAEHMNDTGKAFEIIEQVRGRVMTDLLSAGIQTSPESLESEKRIARLRLKLMETHSNREVRDLRDQIFVAEQSRSITPEISILKSRGNHPESLKQVQNNLSPSEALLEYVLGDPGSFCLVITRENSRIVKLPGKQTITPIVSAYLKEVAAKHSAHDEARRLYDAILGPISEAQNKAQLIIVRDGQLHRVPFDALIDRNDRYVLESRIAVYSPSATSFSVLRNTGLRKNSSQRVLAVGGIPYDRNNLRPSAITRGYSETALSNLPSSREEALAAAAAFPEAEKTLLLGDDATESAFKKAAKGEIIHLAVHAIANETRPERSALVLLSDPGEDEDGFLEATEIVQLRLNTNLVVLSACDTAVGPLEGQEGVSTLSKAFLLAGARTVVSTLWSVEDETTLYLMKNFYRELSQKNRVQDALTAAKRTMLKTYGSKAVPYYWAGFTVEGSVEPPSEH